MTARAAGEKGTGREGASPVPWGGPDAQASSCVGSVQEGGGLTWTVLSFWFFCTWGLCDSGARSGATA